MSESKPSEAIRELVNRTRNSSNPHVGLLADALILLAADVEALRTGSVPVGAPPPLGLEHDPEPDGDNSAPGNGTHKVWSCKIGYAGSLPPGADWPLRKAVREAFASLTGKSDDFCFSGWGASLSATEREIVEERHPKPPPPEPAQPTPPGTIPTPLSLLEERNALKAELSRCYYNYESMTRDRDRLSAENARLRETITQMGNDLARLRAKLDHGNYVTDQSIEIAQLRGTLDTLNGPGWWSTPAPATAGGQGAQPLWTNRVVTDISGKEKCGGCGNPFQRGEIVSQREGKDYCAGCIAVPEPAHRGAKP